MKEKILKKGIKKRIISVVLALAMVLILMPRNSMTVYAAPDTSSWPTSREHTGCEHTATSHFYATGQTYQKDGVWYVEGRRFPNADTYDDHYDGDTSLTSYEVNGFKTETIQQGWYYFGNSGGLGFIPCTATHTHTWATAWTTDATQHWHAATCEGHESEKSDLGEHTGGTATCQAQAVCSTCGSLYGSLGSHNWGSWVASTGKRSCQTSGCTAEDTCTHDWTDNNGECKTCHYQCTHGDATEGTCSTCHKNLGTHTHNQSCYGTKTSTTHSTNCGRGTAVTNENHNFGAWDYSTDTRTCGTCGATNTCTHTGGVTDNKCDDCGKDLGSGSGSGSEPEPEPTHSEPASSSSSEEDTTPSVPEVDETTFKVDIVKNDKTEVHNDITEDLHVSSEAYNLSQFKTVKGFAFGIDTAVKTEQKKSAVAEVKSNKVEVYTGTAQTFGKECIEVLKTSPVDVVYTFKHKGLLFRVTIPAGTDISALLDKNGFAGPLWIGKELGTAEIIKE